MTRTHPYAPVRQRSEARSQRSEVGSDRSGVSLGRRRVGRAVRVGLRRCRAVTGFCLASEFIQKSLGLSLGNVTLGGFLEVLKQVTFGLGTANSDVAGPNTIRP